MLERPLEPPHLIERKRGFASLPVEKRREIAQQGGKAAQARGAAHKFTIEEAREAGRRGGRSISSDRLHMSMIGRKGGLRSGKRRQAHGD